MTTTQTTLGDDGGSPAAAGTVLTADGSGKSSWQSLAGHPVLIYRYTVTGSDKASIDSGVDTADAGSNDWTNGDLLEAYLYARTDETAVGSTVNLTFNNDAGNNYDVQRLEGANATASASASVARANWFGSLPGASCTANVFGTLKAVVPNFSGTVGFKAGQIISTLPDETAANDSVRLFAGNYRSTSAITRLAVAPNTAGKKLKVGSQLLIYKRLAS